VTLYAFKAVLSRFEICSGDGKNPSKILSTHRSGYMSGNITEAWILDYDGRVDYIETNY
jgi:hypothetical protein